MEIKLAQNSWYGGASTTITLPEDWDVTWCGIPADAAPVLDRAALKKAIDSPIGTKTIRELALGKKEAAIVFDDMSRGTPCSETAEIVVEELLEAGIDKGHIRFICALGSHGACDRTFFEKKLGKNICSEYAVFNHNPYQSTVYVGTTSGGVEIHTNEELMSCDLKIGLGSISPHPVNGFGGGAKIVAIGCGSIETIAGLHDACSKTMSKKGLSFFDCVGNLEQDGMRNEVEEAGKLIGLDFKIDAVLNTNCEIVALTAGDPIAEYYEGVKYAKLLNFTDKHPKDMDVVIVNANVKANEAAIAISLGAFLTRKGGTVVLVDFCAGGQVVHQYSGLSGYFTGGPGYRGRRSFPDLNKIIYYTENPDRYSLLTFGEPEYIEMVSSWADVQALLADYGPGTKAAVVADGTITAYPAL